MNLPPLNLPPIRVDGQQQLPQQHQQPGQPMGSPLPPQQHGMPQYYAHPGHPPPGQPMPMGSQHLAMRYQLPPQPGEQRILSGGRHKKEIKRRTKTGCLTCRKRRIKCDEAHPVCRNCQKSKRECMGYDPIFKQQPGPANLQPAPNSTQHQPSVPATSPPASASSQYSPQVPQGYAPASTVGYAPAASTASSTPSHHDNFNNPAIDPALAATDPAMNGQPPYNGAHALQAGLRGSPYSSAPPEAPILKGRPLRIEEIFSICGYNPPEVPPRLGGFPHELDEEFSYMFSKDYCLGLDSMLETNWFSTNNNGISRVLSDQSLHEEAIFFVETVKIKTGAADVSQVFSQEARLIWHLLGTCRIPSNSANDNVPNGEHDDLSLREARARFDILEALLTNQTLEVNPLRQLSYTGGLSEEENDKFVFWDSLGEFVVHANVEAVADGTAEVALTRMRNVLKAREVRDAIYSIALARQIGNRVRGFPDAVAQIHTHDPENDVNKLTVAMSFISHECRSGTQQVIARVCDMACLSWRVSRSP
ncbi:hypothetical protein SLS60_002593 [Paraconiothyrium brasiliense]|uniref:Zn(2)-C6 fungal-type domain-containing protein n=1 Tax=Paraconiothyrium brasiliense TaxID=300254 RepID=A0ABR3RTA2_9PLEO